MIETEPYAPATDASNDEGLIKMNSLTVRCFDTAKDKTLTQFLDV